jgi:hypothetical protein
MEVKMGKIWYHTPTQINSYAIIWSCASSLKEAGEKLAKLNKAFPSKSDDLLEGKSFTRSSSIDLSMTN